MLSPSEISTHLRQMFERRGEEGCPHNPHGGMSVAEKILMWDSSYEGQSPGPGDASEPLVGVEEGAEASSHHEVSLYSRAALHSKPYRLFIKDLLKHSSPHWGESQPCWTMDSICHRIMRGIPPPSISNCRCRRVHKAEFRIPWRHIKQRILREKERRNASTGKAISAAVVLVSSSNNVIQATTLEEYIRQTWGMTDLMLLTAIRDIMAQNDSLAESRCKWTAILAIVITVRL